MIQRILPLKKSGEMIGEPSFLTREEEKDGWLQRGHIFPRTRECLVATTSAE